MVRYLDLSSPPGGEPPGQAVMPGAELAGEVLRRLDDWLDGLERDPAFLGRVRVALAEATVVVDEAGVGRLRAGPTGSGPDDQFAG